MKTNTCAHISSERGVALVIVLLLMAVLSGLATGFAMNGQVEATMAHNEVYYAGARAAAEAGINRATAALRLEQDINVLAGADGLVDNDDMDAAVNDDNGDLGFLLTGAAPYPLGDPNGEYSYSIAVFDDDDPVLYAGGDLTAEQLIAIGNEGNAGAPDRFTDHNTRLILRATGFGPSNTMVRVSRMLLTTITPIPGSTVNPAILVDGDVDVVGSLSLLEQFGSIHANGDMTIGGNAVTIDGDATSSGDLTVTSNNFTAGGQQGGGYASINVPEVTASDYSDIADYILKADGSVVEVATNDVLCAAPCGDWAGWEVHDVSGAVTWELKDNTTEEGTFFVEGKVSVSGSPKGPGNTPLNVTLVAQGSISITGNPKFSPDQDGNPETIQFVTDGDLRLEGTGDFDDPTQIEGQIFVREQIHTQGSWDFQGRIIVQNDANDFDEVTDNSLGGTPTVTYTGSLPGYVIPPTTEYTYNVTGWIEQ